MYELLDRSEENRVGIRVSGTLTEGDYERLRPLLKQRAREHGPLDVLFLMVDWHGWASLSAMWEDLKTDAALNEKIRRLAMVGEADWERWITKLAEPFARGEVRYFDRSELEKAWAWVEEHSTAPNRTES